MVFIIEKIKNLNFSLRGFSAGTKRAAKRNGLGLEEKEGTQSPQEEIDE